MKILELLLPKGLNDKSISQKHATKIDALQKRMDSYVDKIGDPNTSAKGREFLKSKLKDDYDELRNVIQKVSEESVNEHIVKTKSGYRLVSKKGKNLGDFSSRKAAAKHEGEVEYFKHKNESVNESIRKLPLTDADFDLVKELMERPIPAVIAPIYISEIIDDDEFNCLLQEFEETNPGLDMRPHIVDWMKRVMPDQMHRFYGGQTTEQRLGQQSVIHGYDPQMYHGTNEPITGNAFGRM